MKKRVTFFGGAAIVFSVAAAVTIFSAQTSDANDLAVIPPNAQGAVNKMLDAVDNYKSLSATIQFEGEEERARTSNVSLKLDSIVKGKSETVFADGKIIKEVQNNSDLQITDSKQKTYLKDKISNDNINKWKERPKQRVSHTKDGQLAFHPRYNPIFVGQPGADKMLFPQDFALGVLQRAHDLKASQGNILNRDATIIEGSPLESQVSEYGDHFKIWVDNETGIILKAEYSKGEKVVKTQTITKLELNHQISDVDFTAPAVEGYKDLRSEIK